MIVNDFIMYMNSSIDYIQKITMKKICYLIVDKYNLL